MSSFITISPLTGSGEVELSISGSTYTGRESRGTSFTLSGSVGGDPVTPGNALVVTQTGKGAPNGFFSVSTSSSTSAFPAAGGTITYSGTSNKASISIGTGTLDNVLTSATINSVSVTKSQLQSGYTVANDPGASAEYNVSFTYTIPANADTSTKTFGGTVGGQSVSVTQSAHSGYNLSFSASAATVNADGTLTSPSSVSVNADSGLTWEITGQ